MLSMKILSSPEFDWMKLEVTPEWYQIGGWESSNVIKPALTFKDTNHLTDTTK